MSSVLRVPAVRPSFRYGGIMSTSPRLPPLWADHDRDLTPKRCHRIRNLHTLPTAAGLVCPAQKKLSSSISRSGIARAIGGGREGRPRQSSILRMASGGWIAARILMRPPHRGHSKTSIERTRRINSAHDPDRALPSMKPVWFMSPVIPNKPSLNGAVAAQLGNFPGKARTAATASALCGPAV